MIPLLCGICIVASSVGAGDSILVHSSVFCDFVMCDVAAAVVMVLDLTWVLDGGAHSCKCISKISGAGDNTRMAAANTERKRESACSSVSKTLDSNLDL